jgi:hypothetical protein
MVPKAGERVSTEPCIGCGAIVPKTDGPTHRYLEASPGCWAIYGEVLAQEYQDPTYAVVHRMTVDAYAVQHPGRSSQQTIQSVAVHLISLYLMFERGFAPGATTHVMQEAKRRHGEDFVWLDPPDSLGAITVAEVAEARDAAEHGERVRSWARCAWDAWARHHEIVREWAGSLVTTSS